MKISKLDPINEGHYLVPEFKSDKLLNNSIARAVLFVAPFADTVDNISKKLSFVFCDEGWQK